MLDEHGVPRSGIALDLFAGTGAVGKLLKRRGHTVWANDWQRYAYVTNAALIEQNRLPEFPRLTLPTQQDVNRHPRCETVLAYLQTLPGRKGEFYEHYCEGGSAGRQYFSRENGLRLQQIRDTIELWRSIEQITESEYFWLVACVIESADRVANTASVYGAYLKHLKATAEKPLQLVALRPQESAVQGHRAFCQDSLALLREQPGPFTLIYIDPPYNARQYSANYHILETLARWDVEEFEPRGLTGLRPAESHRSAYSLASTAQKAFTALLSEARADYVLFSYNNEGLVPEATLLQLLGAVSDSAETVVSSKSRPGRDSVSVTRIPFKRFRADADHEKRTYSADATEELLILARLRSSSPLSSVATTQLSSQGEELSSAV